MAKKAKKLRSLPKRVAGVKIPKALRRYADTPLGSALIAEAMVECGKAAITSPAVRQAAEEIRQNVAKTGVALAIGLQEAARASAHAMPDAVGGARRGGNGVSQRLVQDAH